MTSEQYLALSKLVYQKNLSNYINSSNPPLLGSLLESNEIDGYQVDEQTGDVISAISTLHALADLEDWQLINFQTSPNGFAAAAFKNPATGEIVFSFRGSEENLLDVDWWGTNAQIVTSLLIPAQLASAEDFVFETMNEHGPVCYESKTAMYDALSESSDVSFTGHSLGGALAQYMDPHNDNKTDMNAKVMVW